MSALHGLAAGVALGLGTGSPGFGLLVFLAVVAAPWVGRRTGSIWWGPVTGLVALVAVAGAWAGMSVESALLGVLAWLLVHRGLTAPGRDRLAVLIVGLILVAASTRSHHIGFLVAILAWLAALPGSLGATRGRGHLVLAALTALVAFPLFWVLPRFNGALPPTEVGRGLTGFADDVELGAMEQLLDDPARVFEASFSEPPDTTPYFRGVALDAFDGRRWTSETTRAREEDWTDPRPDLVRVDVTLEAHPEGVLFVPGVVEGIDAGGVAVDRDRAGAYHLPGPPRAVEYAVFTSPPYGPGRGDPFRDAPPSLELPPLSTEVRALFVARTEGQVSPDDRITALVGFLRAEYAYTREPRDTDAEAPLEEFLLSRKEGHCEYFASALAVGGRVVGVPTRVVNGFVGGEAGPDGSIVFRRYHAHSWVEYFDGDRWVTADATPRVGAPAGPGWATQMTESLQRWWDQSIVEFDAEAQLGTARAVADVVVPAAPEGSRDVIGVVLVGSMAGLFLLGVRIVGARLLRRWQGTAGVSTADPVTRQLEKAWRLVEAAGLELPPGPDVEVARWVRERHPETGARLEELAWLSYEVRFGRGDPGSRAQRASELRAAVAASLVA